MAESESWNARLAIASLCERGKIWDGFAKKRPLEFRINTWKLSLLPVFSLIARTEAAIPMRFLLYSHDGLGLGHTRRHLAIARALNRLAPKASVLLATGTDDVNRLGLPAQVEILKLPSLRKIQNGEYASRRLQIPTAEIREMRSALLATTVRSFRPSVAVVDRYPFGAKGEFREALLALKKIGGKAVLGFRDILDSRDSVLAEWEPENLQEQISEHFDRLLIYGLPSVFDPLKEYDLPSLRKRTTFCGYLVNEDLVEPSRPSVLAVNKKIRPIVLATAGGGEDGFALLETFMRAAENAPWQGVLVSGPMLPEDKLDLLKDLALKTGTQLHSFVPQLSTWLCSADALVSMGGYNTMAEAVSCGMPTVCVPRVSPRTEQLIRSLAFEKMGLVKNLHPHELTVKTLRKAIAEILAQPRDALLKRAMSSLDFDGASRAARCLIELAQP